MAEMTVNKSDELVMKLLHYFITEQGYNPIVLHGAKDEIWLENLDKEYKIIRIVTNYIHNDEQLNFDLFRTSQIMGRIKKKTLSLKINALSLFLNLGDNVHLEKGEADNIKIANIQNAKDIKKYQFITDIFPSITKISKSKEVGVDLFMKLTGEINKKSEQDAAKAENVFKIKTPNITYILIGINLIVYLLMYILGKGAYDNATLVNFGALVGSYVKQGELWRLITAGFIHIGIFHLMFNMYALYIIGQQIESFYGKTKYLAIYFGSLIIASLLSMLFHVDVISAGASGAIFGLLGALLYFGYHYRIYLGTVIRSQILPIIILNLSLGFVLPGIDNAAHIGGLIGGILLSMAVGVKFKSKKVDIINGVVLTTIFTLFLIFMNFM